MNRTAEAPWPKEAIYAPGCTRCIWCRHHLRCLSNGTGLLTPSLTAVAAERNGHLAVDLRPTAEISTYVFQPVRQLVAGPVADVLNLLQAHKKVPAPCHVWQPLII